MSLLSPAVASIGQSIGGNVGGLHRLTDGLGDGVIDGSASDLGDDVAVLDLNGHALHLGVVHTVLGGDLTASVLDSGDSRVGNSVSNRGHIGGMGITQPLSISIGLSLGLSLDNVSSGEDGGSITENINNILADLLVLNLLGGNGLGGAHILCNRGASLGSQDLILHLAVGGRCCEEGGGQQLGVSLGISSRSSHGGRSQVKDSKQLKKKKVLNEQREK